MFVSSFRPDVTGVIHILDVQIIGDFVYCSGYIIEYEIPKTTRVNLKIYNILGQEIKTLIDYEQQTGNYQIIWDGTDNYNIHVSSGIYIQDKSRKFRSRKKNDIVEIMMNNTVEK